MDGVGGPIATTPKLSLDEIGNQIIVGLDIAVRHLLKAIEAGDVSREVIGALKDCQVMLKDLKKDEKDFLAGVSDKELEDMLK